MNRPFLGKQLTFCEESLPTYTAFNKKLVQQDYAHAEIYCTKKKSKENFIESYIYRTAM